jgi:hypothetical protein
MIMNIKGRYLDTGGSTPGKHGGSSWVGGGRLYNN